MAITDALCRSFLDLWWHFDPAAATWAGAGASLGADERLGRFDADSMRQHLAAFRSIAGSVEDLEVEEAADEIDRTALLDHLRVLRFQLEGERPWQRNPALWLEHLASALEGPLAPGALLARLRALPRFLEAAQDTVSNPPLFFLDTALSQLPGLGGLLARAARRFETDWSADAGDAAKPLADAHGALEQYRVRLLGALPDADPHAAAIGEEALDRRLHYEHASIHNTPEAWRGALRLAAEVESEVTACAAVLDAGRPWREVVAGLGPVESTENAELAEVAERVGLRGLMADAPALEILPLPEWMQVLEPHALYRPAGAAPAALLLGDPARAEVAWLAVRLGVPGVHLHRTRADALGGCVRRQIGASSTPAGWGLYVQQLLAEAGWPGTAEARLVERVLFLREVHLAIADLGLHSRQLTPEEAVAQLTGHAMLDSRAAVASVRRIACRPGSACAAILGQHELVRLRRDAETARGSGFSLAGFHEELFSYGGLPVPLIRWGMGLDV